MYIYGLQVNIFFSNLWPRLIICVDFGIFFNEDGGADVFFFINGNQIFKKIIHEVMRLDYITTLIYTTHQPM